MRIGASISGTEKLLLNALADANAAAALHAVRLSTGKKISSPAHGPAAFVQIAGLESRLRHNDATLANVQAASNVVAETQLVLDQIRTEFETIRAALEDDENLSLTAEQRTAKQAEIDEALAAVNELATSSIAGRRRLDGSTDFRRQGLDSSQIRNLQVFSVRETEIRGVVTTEATQGQLTYTGAGGQITSTANFDLTGELGTVTLAVTASDDLDDVAATINRQSHQTGVTAAVSGNALTFTAVGHGTRGTIAIEVNSGTFAVTGGNGDGTAQGVDAVATLNGESLTGDGNLFTYHRNGLRFRLEFQDGFAGEFDPITVGTENIQRFQLTPEGESAQFALAGVLASQFRSRSGSLDDLQSGGSLAGLSTNTSQALRVVDEALARLTLIDGAVDGFADHTIASSAELLADVSEALEDALTAANGIDEDEETLLVAKNQQLADNVLASLAILQQQRTSMVTLLQQIAGL